MGSITTDYEGTHLLDITALQGRLVHLKPGSRRGMRVDLEGYPQVTLQLAQSMPAAGAAAGIPQDVYDHFLMCNETVSLIDQGIAIAHTQLQVLKDSRAFYVDARNNDISLMVDAMRSRAQRRKDDTILTPFVDVIHYANQTGEKAARARRRNAEAAEEAAQEAAEEAAEEAEAQEATEAEPDLRAELEAYKAELKEQFDAAVQAAVARQLAATVAAAIPTATAAASAA